MFFAMQTVTKERLQAYLKLRREIDSQNEQIVRVHSNLESAAGTSIDGAQHQKYVSDRMSIMIARLETLNLWLQVNIAIEKYERSILEKAFRLILYPHERRVLELKYLDNLSWQEVVEEMYGKLRDYQINAGSYLSNVYSIHRRALLYVEVVTSSVYWMNLKN